MNLWISARWLGALFALNVGTTSDGEGQERDGTQRRRAARCLPALPGTPSSGGKTPVGT
jgi:hypothetical protein